MTRRPRGLRPDERDLWQRVAATAKALHPERPKPTETGLHAPAKPKTRFAEFQIGSAAHPHPERRDHPSGPEDMLAQPLRIDRRLHQRLMRGKTDPEARIDLHGMTLAEAHPELIRFVLSSHAAGRRLLLVITGKGKAGPDSGPIPQRIGVLRHQVPHWLTQPPLGTAVLQVTQAHIRHGGAGAYYVYLRRSRQG